MASSQSTAAGGEESAAVRRLEAPRPKRRRAGRRMPSGRCAWRRLSSKRRASCRSSPKKRRSRLAKRWRPRGPRTQPAAARASKAPDADKPAPAAKASGGGAVQSSRAGKPAVRQSAHAAKPARAAKSPARPSPPAGQARPRCQASAPPSRAASQAALGPKAIGGRQGGARGRQAVESGSANSGRRPAPIRAGCGCTDRRVAAAKATDYGTRAEGLRARTARNRAASSPISCPRTHSPKALRVASP